MPSLDAFLQFIMGAGGASALLGIWLYVTRKENTDLKAEVKALNAKVEARDAQRLLDYQGPLRDVAEALFAASESEQEDRPPTTRHKTGGRSG